MSFLKELARIFNIEIKDNATNAEIDDLLKDIPTVAEQITAATKESNDNLTTALGAIEGYEAKVGELETSMSTLKEDVLKDVNAAIEAANKDFKAETAQVAKEVNAVKLLKQGANPKTADPLIDEGDEDDKEKGKKVVKADFLDNWLDGTIVK